MTLWEEKQKKTRPSSHRVSLYLFNLESKGSNEKSGSEKLNTTIIKFSNRLKIFMEQIEFNYCDRGFMFVLRMNVALSY